MTSRDFPAAAPGLLSPDLSDLTSLGLRVLKFGGTSVATPDAIRQLITIVRQARAEGPVVVVVSA